MANSEWNWTSPSGLVVARKDEIKCEVKTVAEGKLAIKELKLAKKELALEKRQVDAQIQAIRTQYSQSTKRRASPMRGGGAIGRFARSMNQISRDSERSKLASNLEPFLLERSRYEARIRAVEDVIVQLEGKLIKAELEEVRRPVAKKAPTPAPAKTPASRKPVKAGRNFCNQCGAAIDPQMRFCGQCGSQLA